jgi:hypothetical protein
MRIVGVVIVLLTLTSFVLAQEDKSQGVKRVSG